MTKNVENEDDHEFSSSDLPETSGIAADLGLTQIDDFSKQVYGLKDFDIEAAKSFTWSDREI